jgi:hypothetical protein
MAEAYARAHDCDRTSAFGGISALNQPLDGPTAERIVEIFTEVVIAPGADDAARATEIAQIITDDILPRLQSDFGIETQLSGQSEQENRFLADAQVGLVLVLLGIYLTLAWIFSSWTRPLVVMSIIPFALVGTIYGHYFWGIPMSLFTVVGLIGMVGIIINDSIVLVTTVDEYAQDRGLVPAIIDGTVDRLRAVLLTTLTTVLGLAPLLYEGSTQAEFLKPTVVTLVFGLAFGMLLVLLVVPSIMAMQADIARQVQSAKRALRGRRRAMALPAATDSAISTAKPRFSIALPSRFRNGSSSSTSSSCSKCWSALRALKSPSEGLSSSWLQCCAMRSWSCAACCARAMRSIAQRSRKPSCRDSRPRSNACATVAAMSCWSACNSCCARWSATRRACCARARPNWTR